MRISEAVTTVESRLKHKSDAPRLDAERILLHVLDQKEPSWLITHSREQLSETQLTKVESMAQQRAGGVPLAYLLGEQEFYGRPFIVNRDVLIPRPATEELVERALFLITKMRQEKERPLIAADIGTGSGCVAITLLLETDPGTLARVIATDISPLALSVARSNAERHRVANRITFVQGDMLAPLRQEAIDLVVSNPPYVPSPELSPEQMQKPEKAGLAFEPRLALDGGTDGCKFSRLIATSGWPYVMEVTGGIIEERISCS